MASAILFKWLALTLCVALVAGVRLDSGTIPLLRELAPGNDDCCGGNPPQFTGGPAPAPGADPASAPPSPSSGPEAGPAPAGVIPPVGKGATDGGDEAAPPANDGCGQDYVVSLRRPTGMEEYSLGPDGQKACDPCDDMELQLNADIDDLIALRKEISDKKELLMHLEGWKREGSCSF